MRIFQTKTEIDGLDVEVVYKKIKRVYLRVTDVGQVSVTAPFSYPLTDIARFVREKRAFIDKRIAFLSNYGGARRKLKYGDFLEYKGEKAEIVYGCGETRYRGGKIFCGEDEEKLSQELERWLIAEAKIYLTEIFQECLKISEEKNVTLALKPMKSRWGCCYSDRRYIALNTELIRVDKSTVEGVCFHELAHLRHADHGERFYQRLTMLCPDYKNVRKKLNSVALR